MVVLLEIGWQPGDVEIPGIGERRVLKPEQPNIWREKELAPRNVSMSRGGMLRTFEQSQLGAVHTFMVLGIVPVPPEEDQGPDDTQNPKKLKGLPPGHEV